MTTAPKLEPCVRCGGPLALHENDWCEPPEWNWNCSACGLHCSGHPSQAAAITDANRRAAPSAGLREALIELVETLEYEGHGDFAGDRSTCSICQEVKKARAALTLSKEGGEVALPHQTIARDE